MQDETVTDFYMWLLAILVQICTYIADSGIWGNLENQIGGRKGRETSAPLVPLSPQLYAIQKPRGREWCMKLMLLSALLRHLLCTFLAVWYFQSCYEESCLPKGEYQKVKYFCLLRNPKEVTLDRNWNELSVGSTCVWYYQATLNAEVIPYLLGSAVLSFQMSSFLTCAVLLIVW